MKRMAFLIGALISGFLIFFAESHVVAELAWFALVPLFLVLENAGPRRTRANNQQPTGSATARHSPLPRFWLGFTASAAFSTSAFAWMIKGASAFTGSEEGIYGFLLFLALAAIVSFACATLLYFTPAILLAPVWIIVETIWQHLSQKMPWFLFHIGSALASSDIAIQPVSVIGVPGAGFVLILVNYLIASTILTRSWKPAAGAAVLFAAYMGWGWLLLPQPCPKTSPSFSLAMVLEHIPPEEPWDSTNGNQRVQQLLKQEQQCIAQQPDMILWSESAIPWTFSYNDDLVHEIIQRAAEDSGLHHMGGHTTANSAETQGIVQLLGMNTTVSAGLVRNSAYCIIPDTKMASRYDKTKPLLFIEEPWLGMQLPFLSSDGYAVEPGNDDSPLNTPYGKVGILICNESMLSGEAASRVRQGAQFLVNMSNDGWFRDTWLVTQHFYNVRLRAVETRKDIAVNSNNGWCGLITAAGQIEPATPTASSSAAAQSDPSETPQKSQSASVTPSLLHIHPNDLTPIAVRYPLLPLYGCLLFGLTIIIINQKSKL